MNPSQCACTTQRSCLVMLLQWPQRPGTNEARQDTSFDSTKLTLPSGGMAPSETCHSYFTVKIRRDLYEEKASGFHSQKSLRSSASSYTAVQVFLFKL